MFSWIAPKYVYYSTMGFLIAFPMYSVNGVAAKLFAGFLLTQWIERVVDAQINELFSTFAQSCMEANKRIFENYDNAAPIAPPVPVVSLPRDQAVAVIEGIEPYTPVDESSDEDPQTQPSSPWGSDDEWDATDINDIIENKKDQEIST